jgi:DNA polymerase-1
VREAFVAPPGCVIASADYSQIELRIMAHISGDHALLHAFHAGLDVHRATAAEVFGVALDQVTSEQRRYAKVINFGLIYGMSSFGLAKNLGIETKAAAAYIDRYFQRYPGVKQYMDETKAAAKSMGYVETVFGRRLYLPEINSPNGPRRAGAERAAINAPMQGTAADLIKMAMVKVQQVLDAEKPGRQNDHAGARRTGVRAARGRGGLAAQPHPAPHGRRGRPQGAAAGRGGRGAQLGQGALR